MSSVPGTLLSEASPLVGGRTKHAPKRVRKTGRTATMVGSRRKSSKPKAAVRRTSEILREIISDESQEVLTVEQIVKALGPTSFIARAGLDPGAILLAGNRSCCDAVDGSAQLSTRLASSQE